MAKPKSEGKGYLLPEVINPLTSKCVVINVPDDLRHFAAFWGALQQLQYATSWYGGTKAELEEVAQVWAQVIATSRQNWESGECIMPAQFRINPSNGHVEYQPYNGTGWQDLGGACACPPTTYSPSYNPDTVNPDDSACAVAVGLGDYLYEKATDIIVAMDAAGTLVGAMDVVFGIFGPAAYIFVDQITDLMKEAYSVGTSQWNNFLTLEHREEAQEWIYCRLLEDNPPQMSQDVWNEFKAWHESTYSGVGGELQGAFYRGLTYELINDRSRIASYGTGNCVAFGCGEWAYEWEFDQLPAVITEINNPAGIPSNGDFINGEWVSTLGSQPAFNQVVANIWRGYNLPQAQYTGIGLEWANLACGNFQNNQAEKGLYVIPISGGLNAAIRLAQCNAPSGADYVTPQTTLSNGMVIYMPLAQRQADSPGYNMGSWGGKVMKLRVKGTGANPFAT